MLFFPFVSFSAGYLKFLLRARKLLASESFAPFRKNGNNYDSCHVNDVKYSRMLTVRACMNVKGYHSKTRFVHGEKFIAIHLTCKIYCNSSKRKSGKVRVTMLKIVEYLPVRQVENLEKFSIHIIKTLTVGHDLEFVFILTRVERQQRDWLKSE